MARTNLKLLRVRAGLSQEEISEKLCCQRGTYSAIECGVRNGKPSFWKKLQKEFDVPNAEMWELMQNE